MLFQSSLVPGTVVVICFPGLEEPQYVKRDGRDSVQGDGGEGLGESEGEIHGENRSNSDEDKGKKVLNF